MLEPAVAADQLSKIYRVYSTPWDRLREALTRRPRHRDFHALDDVSFTLVAGEGLAIIGENGAGKSTLLKILAGISAPSRGRVAVRGKVASILELGSGFHPEFTGRQNVVLNAAMLGLAEDELRQKMPAILAWSELGEFIDQPVKCYSTGMAMRLGFSIATQVEPDVLIIDEALSVGDGYFQKKCMDRLLQFVGAGGTLLFCSHAMYYASAFCRRALWLRHGRAEALGPVAEVVRAYESFLLTKGSAAGGGTAAAAEGPPPGPASPAAELAAEAGASSPRPAWLARIVDARLVAPASGEPVAEGGRPPVYAPGAPWELEIVWETEDPRLVFHVGVGINRADGLEVTALATHLDGLPPATGARRYRRRLAIPRLPLVKGEFMLYVFLLGEEGLHIFDQLVLRDAFSVQGTGYAFGVVAVDHLWREVEALQAAAARRAARRL